MTKKINSIERCDCNVIHEDIVNQVRDKMPQEESLYDLAELFKVYYKVVIINTNILDNLPY